MLALLAFFACKTPENSAPAPIEDDVYPEVWGPQAAEDHDPTPGVVEVHMSAELASVSWVDGGMTEVWSYNGQLPGPLIQANVGDLVRVVFDNKLPEDETTIHWHGLRIDNLMDGVPAVQAPVEPGEQFVYEFIVPDSGSYWYHPHVRSNEQVERGLYGALVVHEADAPEVDKDRFFVIDDVYLDRNDQVGEFALSGMDGMHGRQGNMLLVNGSAEMLTDTTVLGGNERWRLVNTANARTMWADVTGARWRVIAIDGTLLETPYETERIQLPVGRRYDVEVIPTEGEVQLRVVLPDGDDWVEYPMFTATAEGEGEGQWLSWPAPTLPEIPETAAQEVELVLSNGTSSSGALEWRINGETFDEAEPIPVLWNTPTFITVKDMSGFEHPFHLHGQFFQVVERNGELVQDDMGQLDTTLINGRDKLVLYTEFDNPGLWMAHCHILEHAELGMMTLIDVQQ